MRTLATPLPALGGIGLILALLLASPVSVGSAPEPGVGEPLGSIHREILSARPRPGDVLLRRGRSLTSRMVLTADRAAGYSHVGVVVRSGDTLAIVHAVPTSPETSQGGVIAEPLEAFLAPRAATAAALLRAPSVDRERGARIADRAELLARAAVPFDGRFDLADQNELYCTELVWWLYRVEGIELVDPKSLDRALGPGRGGYLLPSDLEASSRLTSIHRAELGER